MTQRSPDQVLVEFEVIVDQDVPESRGVSQSCGEILV
jgi:hypothetical protein